MSKNIIIHLIFVSPGLDTEYVLDKCTINVCIFVCLKSVQITASDLPIVLKHMGNIMIN